MLVWALDIATTTGFAWGYAGDMPKSGSVRLRRGEEPQEIAPFNIMAFLRDRMVFGRPDLVCLENYLNPAGHKSADAIILQIQCFGAAVGLLQLYGVRFEVVAPATWRKHYLGQANFGERKATKRAAISRAIALRYLPHGCKDDDRADALGIWDYASATFARVRPASLVLFGEAAP